MLAVGLGTLVVPLDSALRVRFDRFLDPVTVVRQSVRITGGTLDANGNPIAGESFLLPTYDALERVAIFRPANGARWLPGVRYTVTLWAPVDRPGGFRAWDGAALPASVTFSFTSTVVGGAPATEVAPVAASYCARCDGAIRRPGVSETLAGSCAHASCHGRDDPGGPAVGLDLGSFDGLRSTALGQIAHETLDGLTETPEVLPSRFGVSMPVIDPGRPGNSYLFYKILIADRLWDDAGDDDRFPAQPVGGSLRPDPAEIARLRETFVSGESMPLPLQHDPTRPSPAALDLGRARALQSWISAGAPLPGGVEECAPVSCGEDAAGSGG